MNNQTANGAGDGSNFYEEPGERGPLTFPEILSAHKAFKMAAAGLIEKPRGVSSAKWGAALELAEDITPGLCWLLGHLGGEPGRLLDLIVRNSGPLTGGLPDIGPDAFPSIYMTALVPPGACPLCGFNHKPKLPHELSPLYQQWFFSVNGRRPTLGDASAHCPEPVQGYFAAFWSSLGVWPVMPQGWTPPHWYGTALNATLAKCVPYIKQERE